MSAFADDEAAVVGAVGEEVDEALEAWYDFILVGCSGGGGGEVGFGKGNVHLKPGLEGSWSW